MSPTLKTTAAAVQKRSKNNAYGRVAVNKMIAALGKKAGLDPGKADPRNLRQLCLDTGEEFQKQADAWVEERYTELLNEEDEKHGWHMWLAYV